ncbi:MAG: hypothetical protein GF308_11935 [Candidatus Heimdallarchaeota archaeon]|nr:hypothetical protein [Candidatus Heimdallarchaeota archaeon]
MAKMVLDCDSPCVSCPRNHSMVIETFQESRLQGVYYCVNCGIITLCKRGVGFRMKRGELKPYCPRCERELAKIKLSYSEGYEYKPFDDEILLVVRIPLRSRFDIAKVLRASFFKDLSEILLYIYFSEGEGQYNIVRYRKSNNEYAVVFSGRISSEKIEIKVAETEAIKPR